MLRIQAAPISFQTQFLVTDHGAVAHQLFAFREFLEDALFNAVPLLDIKNIDEWLSPRVFASSPSELLCDPPVVPAM